MKIYYLNEIGDIKLTLRDVSFGSDGDSEIIGHYTPKDKIEKECSYCGKNKQIDEIEGIKFLTDTAKVKKPVYHQEFRLICEACLVAKNI